MRSAQVGKALARMNTRRWGGNANAAPLRRSSRLRKRIYSLNYTRRACRVQSIPTNGTFLPCRSAAGPLEAREVAEYNWECLTQSLPHTGHRGSFPASRGVLPVQCAAGMQLKHSSAQIA
eukprot:TRINITY_DN27586_c0_g1_i1.p2 TRINITY_DN27586_c0_g1~~TRINITY_DN27586_c0_g1_i1.p2  ORF type:complete len:120 (+),score=9.49 TRINITY_DN27586_c0_g1_i1:632-991(+)